MFKKDFVVCIKAEGKVLREYDNTVLIPFGTEYSIYLKNLRTERAVVNISIDGEDILNGNKLVINGNDDLNLERFLETSDKGHRFKFIEKTQKISEYRGDKPEDGIIRIEYQFEKKLYSPPYYGGTITVKGSGNFGSSWTSHSTCTLDASLGNVTGTVDLCTAQNTGSSFTCSTVGNSSLRGLQTSDGITAHGSISNQGFKDAYVGSLESERYVITLQLKGQLPNAKVEEVITVRNKLVCKMCGTQNKSNMKYCGECGNCLIEL